MRDGTEGINIPLEAEQSGTPSNYGADTVIFDYVPSTSKKVNDVKNMSMKVTVKSGANEPPYFVIKAKSGSNSVYLTSWFKSFATPLNTENNVKWGVDVYEVTAGTGYAIADAVHTTTPPTQGSKVYVSVEEFYNIYGDYDVENIEIVMFGGSQEIIVENFSLN